MVGLNDAKRDYARNGANIDDSDRPYAASGLKPGKAYGLYEREAIGPEMPRIRDVIGTPADVEISLKDIDGERWNPALKPIIDDARDRGIRHVAEATIPGATNERAAGETAAIFNQSYQSRLFDEGEPFRGAVVFEKYGKSAFMD